MWGQLCYPFRYHLQQKLALMCVGLSLNCSNHQTHKYMWMQVDLPSSCKTIPSSQKWPRRQIMHKKYDFFQRWMKVFIHLCFFLKGGNADGPMLSLLLQVIANKLHQPWRNCYIFCWLLCVSSWGPRWNCYICIPLCCVLFMISLHVTLAALFHLISCPIVFQNVHCGLISQYNSTQHK